MSTLSIFIATNIFFLTSCIYTKNKDYKDLKVDEISFNSKNNFYSHQHINYKLNFIFLKPSELPFELFFKKLAKGQLRKSLQSINLTYEPANYSNSAIQMLNEEGFIPVYIELTNTGLKPIYFDEKSFILINSSTKEQLSAFYAEALPKELERFNTKALAANIYNTGVVVLGYASIFGILYVGLVNDVHMASADGALVNGISNVTDRAVYNPLNKSIEINYKNLLVSQSVLKPNETARGLLFYYDHDEKFENIKSLQFNYSEVPQVD